MERFARVRMAICLNTIHHGVLDNYHATLRIPRHLSSMFPEVHFPLSWLVSCLYPMNSLAVRALDMLLASLVGYHSMDAEGMELVAT